MLLNSQFKMRIEHFGVTAKDLENGSFYKFQNCTAVIIFLLTKIDKMSRNDILSISEKLDVSIDEINSIFSNLSNYKILNINEIYASDKGHNDQSIKIAEIIDLYKEIKPKKEIVKPFWSHLQPFTRCNQKCVHCYCSGGPNADPFILPLEKWFFIIDKLDKFGVFDVYITGGENLICDEFFELSKYILSKKLGYGMSTNATLLTKKNINRLKDLNLRRIQVSIDASTPEVYKMIRGVDTFYQAISGLKEISHFTEPVINTVVNKKNYHQLEDIVLLGMANKVSKFKFFPQKNCGRTITFSEMVFNDKDIKNLIIPKCLELSKKYTVEIETIGQSACGSGTSGFAVDQYGFAYPCIFGVEDHTQRIGNILEQDLEDIWFDSKILNTFRQLERGEFCHRCEKKLTI